MLTAAEKQAIDSARAHYPDNRAAGLDALKIVQQHRGWIADEALDDVASYLGLDPAALEGVATFYNLIYRKPVGRHVIHVCDSISCWLTGYPQLRAALCERLDTGIGETTADGRFTLLPVVCLGFCERAPALMIDGRLHGDVSAERLDELLANYP